jgi:hypothetical protein
MSAALGALLKGWVIPRCNAHVIRAYTMKGNDGSVGVFKRNGSVLSRTEAAGLNLTPATASNY